MTNLNHNIESIMKWVNYEIEEGENAIVIYSDLQTFSQVCTQYVKVNWQVSHRSLGPALVSLNLSYDWIYWIVPIIGAILAVLCFRAINDQRAKEI